jgi:putative acetyltransferase
MIRPERADDAALIRDILIAAFSGAAEADLVERLRHNDDLALALVAENSGYIAFPNLTVEENGTTHGVVGLAPVAVTPAHQRRGIGGALIRKGHRLLAAQGTSLSFVLGDPDYYTRFGYDLAAAEPFDCAYAGPHFMALRLRENAPQAGTIRYPAAFEQLG